MEPIPTWLDAAVTAAGLSTAYIADDWSEAPRAPAANAPDADDRAANDPSAGIPH